jgi:hypothetical protein
MRHQRRDGLVPSFANQPLSERERAILRAVSARANELAKTNFGGFVCQGVWG